MKTILTLCLILVTSVCFGSLQTSSSSDKVSAKFYLITFNVSHDQTRETLEVYGVVEMAASDFSPEGRAEFPQRRIRSLPPENPWPYQCPYSTEFSWPKKNGSLVKSEHNLCFWFEGQVNDAITLPDGKVILPSDTKTVRQYVHIYINPNAYDSDQRVDAFIAYFEKGSKIEDIPLIFEVPFCVSRTSDWNPNTNCKKEVQIQFNEILPRETKILGPVILGGTFLKLDNIKNGLPGDDGTGYDGGTLPVLRVYSRFPLKPRRPFTWGFTGIRDYRTELDPESKDQISSIRLQDSELVHQIWLGKNGDLFDDINKKKMNLTKYHDLYVTDFPLYERKAKPAPLLSAKSIIQFKKGEKILALPVNSAMIVESRGSINYNPISVKELVSKIEVPSAKEIAGFRCEHFRTCMGRFLSKSVRDKGSFKLSMSGDLVSDPDVEMSISDQPILSDKARYISFGNTKQREPVNEFLSPYDPFFRTSYTMSNPRPSASCPTTILVEDSCYWIKE